MTLTILPQREPFARADGEAQIVRGPTFWRFRASLEKYCRGRTLGRSIVISGNRGVGKTTMVLAAIEDVRRQSEEERVESASPAPNERSPAEGPRAALNRPLLVPLNGPDIMRERIRPRTTSAKTASARSKAVTQSDPSANGEAARSELAAVQTGSPETADARLQMALTAAEPRSKQAKLISHVEDSDNLLRQIARALHIAVAREFAHQYVETLPQNTRPEWLEAGAQLRLELAAGAKIQLLRRFWDLSGRFWSGVLFKPPTRDRVLGAPAARERKGRQGLCELVALDASADAYRIAIGKVEEDISQTLTESDGEQQTTWSDELKNLAAPFAGLLGGAATGFGVFHSIDSSSATKTVTSIGAALLSAIVLTLSISPKRVSKGQATSKFSRDNGVGSLAWRLGGIVDLLFQAGIAPIFVIDELDKVTLDQDLGTWIGQRAKELKSLLTEHAFFCFLTGRSFAEKLHHERAERTYPPSYTQFSNYLFVNYLPIDLHRYLEKIVVLRKDSGETPQNEEMQAAILPYVVLFRAEMHPIEIQRELNSLIVNGDEIQLYPTDKPVPRVDSFALVFQIAVEIVLSDPDIARRMRDDPRFALLAVDAVYYAPRMWRRNADLDISADAIHRYLERRRTPDDVDDDPQDEDAADVPSETRTNGHA